MVGVVSDFFDKLAKNPNLKKHLSGERGGGGGGGGGGGKLGKRIFRQINTLTLNLPKQMFQMALLLLKENACAKLF